MDIDIGELLQIIGLKEYFLSKSKLQINALENEIKSMKERDDESNQD